MAFFFSPIVSLLFSTIADLAICLLCVVHMWCVCGVYVCVVRMCVWCVYVVCMCMWCVCVCGVYVCVVHMWCECVCGVYVCVVRVVCVWCVVSSGINQSVADTFRASSRSSLCSVDISVSLLHTIVPVRTFIYNFYLF